MKCRKCPQHTITEGKHTRRDFLKVGASAGVGLGLLCMGFSSFADQSKEKHIQDLK